ncbi:MAG: hypothetical protein ABJA35_13235 [Parafilimonas sp.]
MLLIVYYAIISYLYYRKQVLEIFTRSGMSANGTQRNKLKTTINDQAQTTHDLSEVHELMYNLQQSISNAQAMKLVKEELMMSLQITIKDFPTLFTSPYRQSINQFLRAEVQEKCAVFFDDQELNSLWAEANNIQDNK